VAKRDPIKTVRALMLDETRRESPNFALLKALQEVFKQYKARVKELSVEDDLPTTRHELQGGAGFTNAITMTTAGTAATGNLVIGTEPTIYATGGEANEPQMSADEYRRARGRRPSSTQDQMLAAMDMMAARSGPDPLAAALQALPHLDILFPSEAEREAFRGQVRGALLGRFVPPAGRVDQTALPAPESAETQGEVPPPEENAP
jgi:hypothetical protein